MQKRYFTSFNKIFVNNITIAADIVSFSYTFQKWYPSFAKPLVSHPKTLGFTSWNPCFHNLKPMLSDCNLMGFRKRSQYCINIQKPHPQPLPVEQGTETNSPPPNPSPLERGVNTLASCWRTGHGDQQPHPHPLPVGEGSEYPCFLLEDVARRPPSYYSLRYSY